MPAGIPGPLSLADERTTRAHAWVKPTPAQASAAAWFGTSPLSARPRSHERDCSVETTNGSGLSGGWGRGRANRGRRPRAKRGGRRGRGRMRVPMLELRGRDAPELSDEIAPVCPCYTGVLID